MEKHSEAIVFLKKAYANIFKELLKCQIEITHKEICSRICYDNSLELDSVINIRELKSIYDLYYHQLFLEDLVQVEDLFEVIIHGNKTIEYITHQKKEIISGLKISTEDLEISLNVLCLKNNQEWNFKNPFCSFLLILNKQEFRCTVIHSSISSNKLPSVFLRKIASKVFSLDSFGNSSSIIGNLVQQKKNIIIAGSTGSGKTSFLKSAISKIPNEEHVIVIEDTHEISFENKNFTNLLANGEENKTMTDFCKYAMRMSPERIILGEIRSHEIVPFVLAMNTGHSGLMATIHANSAKDTLSRLAMLFSIFSNASQSISYEQILKLICKNIDYVVFLEDKKIKEVVEVKGSEGMDAITLDIRDELFQSIGSLENLFYAS